MPEGFLVDILVNHKLVIEINGLFHYVKETSSKNALSLIKTRNLLKAGYSLIEIPVHNYTILTTLEHKLHFIRNLLNNHL